VAARAGLNKEEVVRAAANLLNAEGKDGLKLNRLAKTLGVRTPSLYNHIDGLPGLYRDLALMNAHALGECLANAAIGKSGPQALSAAAQAYREYIKSHSGLYLANLRSAPARAPVDVELNAAEQRVVQIGQAIMASFGLQGEDALHAVRGLRSLVHGFATLEAAGGFGLPLDCDESFRRLVETFIRGLVHQDENTGEITA
jgi:AcrR family transcriptional regulator